MLAIDLCAGSGWAVACQRLGISELGIEIMPEVIVTRDAMGVYTQDVSIADLPDSFCSQAPIQIAGPPCQTFSMAGSGAGRQALADVLSRVDLFHHHGIFTRGGSGDPRTWLVLEPLRLAVGGLPRFIVWEQVPPVLPVWESCAKVLVDYGYSVWTGIIQAEQYGVPQTRKRAFLIARRDGVPAAPPVPTHSRYHNRSPERLDPGVLPWVSMAQALGWGVTGRPSFTVTGGGSATGGAEPFGRAARDSLLSSMTTGQQWPDSNGDMVKQERSLGHPAPTVTGNTGAWHYQSSTMPGATVRDEDWVQRSNYTGRGERSVPSPVPESPNLGARQLTEPSSTISSKAPHWAPSAAQSIRVSMAEAAVLQTFPADHPFQGTKGKQYLQIGNAVPPLLGEAILRTFLEETTT